MRLPICVLKPRPRIKEYCVYDASTGVKFDIQGELHACPYCGAIIDEHGACCGESGHAEVLYLTSGNNSFYLNEIESSKTLEVIMELHPWNVSDDIRVSVMRSQIKELYPGARIDETEKEFIIYEKEPSND